MKRTDARAVDPGSRAWIAAIKVMRDPARSKKAMTAAGLALTQRRRVKAMGPNALAGKVIRGRS